MPAMPLSPAVELVRMIDPPLPAAIIDGTAAFTVLQTPVRLTASISSQESSLSVHAFAANEAMPALALTMSSRPNSDTPSSTIASTARPSLTSASRAMMRRSRSSTCRAVAFRSSGTAIG